MPRCGLLSWPDGWRRYGVGRGTGSQYRNPTRIQTAIQPPGAETERPAKMVGKMKGEKAAKDAIVPPKK